MLRNIMVAMLLVSTLSTPVSAGAPFKGDPVFNRVWVVAIGALTVIAGTGIGVLFGTMVGPNYDKSCCAWQKQCESSQTTAVTNVAATCTGGNCAACLTQYEACCSKANDGSTKVLIVSAVIGAAIGLTGFVGVLVLNKVCRRPPEPEQGPLIV